jgi:hypothetical protein
LSRIAAALSALLIAGPALAYRPFDGTDADVAARGEFELELGPVGYLREGTDRRLVAMASVLNLGIADRFELVLEGRQNLLLSPAPGAHAWQFVDPALSVKTVLRKGVLQDQSGPSIASEVGLLLPTSEVAALGVSAALIASDRFGPVTFHLNGAALWTRNQTAGWMGGLIAEGPSAWPVRPVVELLHEGESGGAKSLSALVGAIWKLREGLSFDAALRLGVISSASSVGALELRAGLTWGVNLFGG